MHRCLAAAVFILLSASLIDASAQMTADGYDYEAAISSFRTEFAAEIDQTVDEWDAVRTMRLEFVAGPFIKGDSIMGAHVIHQKRVFKENSEHRGRTVDQTVSSWCDATNPGVYLSLEQLRERYPRFAGKRARAGGETRADAEEKLLTKLHHMRETILKLRMESLARLKKLTSDASEMGELYRLEKEMMAKKWSASSTAGLIIGESSPDLPADGVDASSTGVSSGEGSLISKDELLVWEMEATDRAERDWQRSLRGYYEDFEADQRKIGKMLEDYLVIKKAAAALSRIGEGSRWDEDETVRRGMILLESTGE